MWSAANKLCGVVRCEQRVIYVCMYVYRNADDRGRVSCVNEVELVWCGVMRRFALAANEP